LFLFSTPGTAQQPEAPPLRISGVFPGGVRSYITEGWGTFDFTVTNLADFDREARVLVSLGGQPDVQYGRDVWVPAHSTRASWLLVGPAPPPASPTVVDLQVLLYERSDGKERLVLPPGEERIRARGVPYHHREPATAVLLDEFVPGKIIQGQLPPPPTAEEEVLDLVRSFREARNLSDYVGRVNPGPLPHTAEGFNSIDHFVIASNRLADDPVGLLALRRWLERGGKVWVLLDRVDPVALAPLLGDALDFEVVDHVSLTSIAFASPAGVLGGVDRVTPRQYDRPVEFARVLLPSQERVRNLVNGWPAWFTRHVGRGKVVFTALGPRAWSRPRLVGGDKPSPYSRFPLLPVKLPALEWVALELHPGGDQNPFRVEAFRQPLTEDVGYSVVSRNTVLLVFAVFILLVSVLGLGLRRASRPELLGWVGPAAALGAAGAFLVLGELSRRAVPPTVAVAQVVDAVSGTPEAAVDGLMAVYRPDSGPAEVSASQGGLFELDMAGLEGQTRRLILTDLGAWHWENLALPAGVRAAPFHYTASMDAPISGRGHFGPAGLEGRVSAGPFQNLADGLLCSPLGRKLAVHFGSDGSFRAGGEDVLPAGQFLTGAVLTERQQRRQELYREFLKRPDLPPREGHTVLLAWAEPVDMHFTLAHGAHTVGQSLLVIPVRMERPAPATRLSIPGPLLTYRRVLKGVPTGPMMEATQATDQHLRFQLPAEVLPLKVERARLLAKISAPSRKVTFAALIDGKPAELLSVASPLDPISIDITDAKMVRPDEGGGLILQVTVSGSSQTGSPSQGSQSGAEKWLIEYLELEVTGQTGE
jgi:hypothetical protein